MRELSSMPPQPLIQTDSADALWEWRVPEDQLQISLGARRILGLEEDTPCSMAALLAACHAEKRDLIRQSLQTFLEGHIGGHVEICFPIHDLVARTQLVTLVRNSNGQAEHVVGCVSAVERLLQQILPSARFSMQHLATPHSAQDAARLILALNASGDGLWDWDATNNNVYYSPRYVEMLGYSTETFPPALCSWEEKIHPEDYAHVVPIQKDIIASPAHGDTFECTYRLRKADGSWAWILGRGNVTKRDAKGRAVRVVGLHTDISASQADRAHLEDLVRNDPLTGLRSRAFFSMTCDDLENNEVRPVGVIVADVNGLKMINDYLGHEEGNNVLCQAALLLRGGLNSAACVARMSGDEFTVLLPGCDRKMVAEVMYELEQRFERHNSTQDRPPVLLALGSSCAETVRASIASAIVDADRAMLRHKLTNRADTRQHIKKWIENNTVAKVSLNDCRYL